AKDSRLTSAPGPASSSESEEIPLDLLLSLRSVDESKLKANIERLLAKKAQVSLTEILETYPPRDGLAELVTYLKIASQRPQTVFVDDVQDIHDIGVGRTVPSSLPPHPRRVRLSRVIFVRETL